MNDEIDVAHSMQTKAELSYDIAVMDRIGGWVEGGRIEDGSQIDWQRACGFIQRHSYAMEKLHGGIRNQNRDSIMKAITCICASVQDNHERISDLSSVLQGR